MHGADEIIRTLGLEPHPEGGYFRETYRAPAKPGARGAVTSIYFLLRAGQVSHWHRIDAAEIWYWQAGQPLVLTVSLDDEGLDRRSYVLGNDLAQGQQPQATVPPHAWQAAKSLGDWTLVGCTVAPAFQFEQFELAPPGWEPGRPLS